MERMTVNLANAFHRLGYDTHILILKNRVEIRPDEGVAIHTKNFDRAFRLTVVGIFYELITRGILIKFNRHARFVYRSFWFSRFFALWLDRLEKKLGHPFELIIARGFGSFEGLACFNDPRMFRIIVNEIWIDSNNWADRYFFKKSFTSSPVLFNSQRILKSFKQICKEFSLQPVQTKLLRNPTNIDDIQAKSLDQISVDKPFILNVGRLEKAKNHKLLLQAFAIIHKHIPHDLVIIGEGTLRTELQKLAIDLGISERVTFTGTISNPYPWMSRADLFVLPSLHEGLPNTVIESLVCNTPVVVTRGKGGTIELMKGELANFIAEMEPDSLAGKIELALKSPPKIEEEFVNSFDMFRVAKEILELGDTQYH